MDRNIALGKAAQAWGTPENEEKILDTDLAEAFADILLEMVQQVAEDISSLPWLGSATNAELLEELKVRMELEGFLNYSTVKGLNNE